MQSRKLLIAKEDTKRSGPGGLSDFVVPSLSMHTATSAKSRTNRLANKSQRPQTCANIQARRIRRGTVFKDENFEAKMRNGKNGVILL